MSDSANDFNSAKWVADFAAQFLQKNLEKIYGGGKRLLKGASENINLLLASYEEYLNCVVDRYSKTRSFLIRDESIDLHKFYVPLGVSCSNKHIPQASIRTLITKNRFVVITGSGGSGKSMMMRYLFLDAVKSKQKVPIFVELRDVNDSDKSILELVKHTLMTNKFGFGDEYIEKALKAGLFAILLDGYDEVINAKQKQVADEIEQLTKDYDKNFIIVSSRPDLEFGGWHPFIVCRVTPLTLEQACELVEKVPGDEELKAKFTRDLQAKLFVEHESFLSNPLLLSIMLLTYKDNAEIPKKLSIFYQQAYEALFNRHDALKGTWLREHATNLDIQDFARIFSAFSLLTYDKRSTSFNRTDVITLLKSSQKLKSIDFNPEDYLTDAKRSVCLLIDDGQYISFSHRSFQEYFTARFIAETSTDKQELLIAKYAQYTNTDKVLHLLYDINPELVERVFIIPEIQKIEKDIGYNGTVNLNNYLHFVEKCIGGIALIGGNDFTVYYHSPLKYPYEDITIFILETCGSHLGLDYKNLEYDNFSKSFVSKLNSSTNKDLDLTDKNLNMELLQLYADSDHIYSMKVLKSILKLRKILEKKQQQNEESLDKILGI